jgi:hypothetical protein
LNNENNNEPNIAKVPGGPTITPYASPLYAFSQISAVLITLDVLIPLLLHKSWQGSIWEQSLFMLSFWIAYSIICVIFIGVLGYLGILFEVAKNLRSYKLSDINNEDVAKSLVMRVLSSNQPRWLISLTPCVVPALSLAFLNMFYKTQLQLDDPILLLQACVLQGVTSFVLALPFILKSQKALDAGIVHKLTGIDEKKDD